MNAERNLLSLKGEIERLDKSLELEMDASTELEERLDELADSIKSINEIMDKDRRMIVEKQNNDGDKIDNIVEYLTSAGFSRKKELMKKMNR